MPEWDATHRLGGLDFSHLTQEKLERAIEQLKKGPPIAKPPYYVYSRGTYEHLTRKWRAVNGFYGPELPRNWYN